MRPASVLSLVGVLGCSAIQSFADPAYKGAFTDFDYFVLAAAADLRAAGLDRHASVTSALRDAEAISLCMHKSGVVRSGSGWTFQPGRWSTYRDNRYAGREQKGDTSGGVAIVANLAPDVSHFSRWPLFLRSAVDGASTAVDSAYYLELLKSLASQFETVVAVAPDSSFPGWRTRNYMDGNNGVYRWDYPSHPGDGYGPYELSGSLFGGWWSFLQNDHARHMFSELASGFPYSRESEATYRGPWQNDPGFRDGRYWLTAVLARVVAGGDAVSAVEADAVDSLLRIHFGPVIERDFWSDERAERATWDLMVPMHAVFASGNSAWIGKFARMAERYATRSSQQIPIHLLARVEVVHFMARLSSLLASHGSFNDVARSLDTRVEADWYTLWTQAGEVVSSTSWGEPKYSDFASYLHWKSSLSDASCSQ